MYQNDSRHKSCKVSQTKNVQMAIILYGCSWSSYKQTSLNLQYLSFHFLWAHFSLLHSLSLNQTEKAFHLLHINCSNQALVQHNPASSFCSGRLQETRMYSVTSCNGLSWNIYRVDWQCASQWKGCQLQ